MPASVLDFWFREIDPKLWWVHDPSFDDVIRSRHGALLERAFEPQLALALSIRSAHVELAEATRSGDASSRTRALGAAQAHLGESTVASSVAARSDLARMALRALARRLPRDHGDGPR